MTDTNYRQAGEATARPEKEKGAIPFESAPTSETASTDYTEVLNRIAAALELHNRLLEGQQDATWSVSNRLEDMMRYMGGGL